MTSSSGHVDLKQDQPHTARMYDYYLGGKTYYEADQVAAEEALKAFPSIAVAAKANRAFMQRATRFLAQEAGIRQFLDIGTGIPTEPNLHQVAQSVQRDARVVYVDNDPIVLAYARALLVGTPEGRTEYIHADAADPTAIVTSPALRETLDLTKPVALSLVAVLHFLPEDSDPYEVVGELTAALAPGSYLVLSHLTADFAPEETNRLIEVYRGRGSYASARSRAEFEKFFRELELVEPGIVQIHRWRPDGIEPPESFDAKVPGYAAVARKG
jgi:SAM-dependent methyltransferase